jgi:O-acetyl-ADP-ribose deacetylase (regulator of RNase III)
MRRIQFRILNEFLGEQPIGTCLIEPTGNPRYPFVGHTPTMRVPGSIAGTDKVYAATWAALVSIYHYNVANGHPIQSVVLPAMGTGFGDVSYSEAARQMAAAYRHYLNPPHRVDWDVVIGRHKQICYDGKQQVAK